MENEDVQEIKPEVKTVVPLLVDQKSQLMVARDNSELMRMIQVMMKGMAFPKTLDTPEKAIAAWQVAASLGLPPAVAIQNMAVIHGSVNLWGQLPKALAEKTGQLEDFKLIKINDKQEEISLQNKNLNDQVWGAVVQIKRKGRSMNEYSFTMLDAEKAGLKGKAGPWKDYTSIMLSRRATAHAIKFEFPDALMGVPVAEFDYHEAPDLKDVSPRTSEAQTMAEKINNLKGMQDETVE